ncbi:Uma2 family endonuclease [Nocardia yamanashiensis]|uniref:Uma2 family endonuclease n=1 Tax=Nocardia yamanashiensis TaxID=209247 RepID=UPI001E525311|nr:Uma2 family endonuclease [Nocardia yamanashiensis]UGT39090.1 Uma2 family endonuclease [Nocardia yamanashiensis]
MHVPASDRWTAIDLDYLPENGLRYEVLNGQLVVNAAPKPLHQWVVSKLERAIAAALPDDLFGLQGVGVLIGDDEPIPDLVVYSGEIDMEGRGIPADQVVLAVEVVSKSTTMTDRTVKPELYAEAKILNYWRVETYRFKGQLPGEALPVLFAFQLAETGEYELTHRAPAGRETFLTSPVELTIDPAVLFPR